MNTNKNSYNIQHLKGPFGYRREGGGVVVYIYTGMLDFDAIDQVVTYTYNEYTNDETGEKILDWSEYDPSTIYTKRAGEISDEWTLKDIADMIDDESPFISKIKKFIVEEILSKNIPLIYIDVGHKKIYQLDEINLKDIIQKNQHDLSVYVREYDHIYSY